MESWSCENGLTIFCMDPYDGCVLTYYACCGLLWIVTPSGLVISCGDPLMIVIVITLMLLFHISVYLPLITSWCHSHFVF